MLKKDLHYIIIEEFAFLRTAPIPRVKLDIDIPRHEITIIPDADRVKNKTFTTKEAVRPYHLANDRENLMKDARPLPSHPTLFLAKKRALSEQQLQESLARPEGTPSFWPN